MKTVCCVDLDGTLLLSDSLFESALLLLRQNPLMIFMLLFWVLRGRAYVKAEIAKRVELESDSLPYNPAVIDWIEQQKSAGHPIYLVTAANQQVAQSIADHLGLFDGVMASSDDNNLKGHRKAQACVEAFGEKQFIYVGDSASDLAVWQKAQAAVCVSHDKKLIKKCRQIDSDGTLLERPKPRLKDYLKAIRVHQYAKNILIFVPIFLDGIFQYAELWSTLLLAFFAFCFTCSVAYIINDLYDLKADRQHEKKRHRPFASGLIPPQSGFYLLLIVIVLSVSSQLISANLNFSLVLICYFILSLAYSQRLKEMPILDVIILTVLYTSRIFAGMLFINEPISNWFLTFSIFFFLSLSFMKRYIELQTIQQAGRQLLMRRGYGAHHDLLVKICGLSCGILSILVFLLYVTSERGIEVYDYPIFLYPVAFFVV